MGTIKRVLGWIWTNLGNIVLIVGWIGGAVILSWAVKAAGFMAQYAPLSWVAAGFVGLFLTAIATAIFGVGRNILLTAKARAIQVRNADLIDPMQDLFQNKRIKITDLINPYDQVVIRKKFIRCELIGPANLLILFNQAKFVGNNFELCDSIEIDDRARPNNAIIFVGCDFEECRFFKVSMIFQASSRAAANDLIRNQNWLNGLPDEETVPVQESFSTKVGKLIDRFRGEQTGTE